MNLTLFLDVIPRPRRHLLFLQKERIATAYTDTHTAPRVNRGNLWLDDDTEWLMNQYTAEECAQFPRGAAPNRLDVEDWGEKFIEDNASQIGAQ